MFHQNFFSLHLEYYLLLTGMVLYDAHLLWELIIHARNLENMQIWMSLSIICYLKM